MFKSIREVVSAIRNLSLAQRQVIYARDELQMAASTLSLASADQLHNGVNFLHEHELPLRLQVGQDKTVVRSLSSRGRFDCLILDGIVSGIRDAKDNS